MNSHENHKLQVNKLHVHFGKICALRNLSFEIDCGHTLALLGVNGAGKSTLLKALAGIITPSGGNIFWKEKKMNKSNYEIAYLPQREEVNWNFPITLEGLVEMGRYPKLGMFKRFGEEDQKIVRQALKDMQLENLRNRQIQSLSGGQQQRAFIARALAQKAHVLLLDEPFSGLDKPSCSLLANIFQHQKKQGRLIIASHHDLNTVNELFDFALLLNCSQQGFGKPAEILKGNSLQTISEN